MDELRKFLDKRAATEWAPGWSDDFKNGYDTALMEVGALIEDHPCKFKRPYSEACGRPRGDETVHVRPDERMRRGAHVWR